MAKIDADPFSTPSARSRRLPTFSFPVVLASAWFLRCTVQEKLLSDIVLTPVGSCAIRASKRLVKASIYPTQSGLEKIINSPEKLKPGNAGRARPPSLRTTLELYTQKRVTVINIIISRAPAADEAIGTSPGGYSEVGQHDTLGAVCPSRGGIHNVRQLHITVAESVCVTLANLTIDHPIKYYTQQDRQVG